MTTLSAAQLFVKSHVSRDLLQNAALFRTDRLVVWEYVSNGLQYVDVGTSPVVAVVLDSKRKRIEVSDNGRGMDWRGLQNFFVMHGENLDRKEGRPGRGRFGTGKSAAFGVADVLRVTSIHRGRKSVVELRRSDLEKADSGDPIPVRTIQKEVETSDGSGTKVEIEDVHLRSLDQAGIIRYIERHLARWPKNASVFVNHHECEYAEPPVAFIRKIQPDGEWTDKLGNAELVLKVSKAPVEEDMRGISILSNGVWHDTTLAGCEGREMAAYIFGEVDVPALDTDTSPIPPFDVSRSMKLNLNNELVQAIYGFIGIHVEAVRRELVAREKERKQTEDARKLTAQASEIARVINEDFDSFKEKVAKIRAKAAGRDAQSDTRSPVLASPADELMFGDELPGVIVEEAGSVGVFSDGGASGGEEPRNLLPEVSARPEGERVGRPAGGGNGVSKKHGAFRVEFKQMGADEPRASYVADERIIFINLDHPQLVAARGSASPDEPTFRRLAYEVAFTEYSIALSSELARRGEYLDPSDPIYEIRETINRLARKAARLYSQ